MEYPKISIVTPTYNQGSFIEETILSVIGQGYPNLEYIIIDGGSTDETVEIIKKYQSHIAYWVSEKDNGQSHAINKGFLKASGNIFGWLNSDDMYMPDCLSKISTFLNADKACIAFGNCIHFKESAESFVSWGSNVVNYSKAATLENVDYISQPSCFWTFKAWQKVGKLNENLHYTFDWEWFLRAQNLGVKFCSTLKCLSLYRVHDSHKSGTGGKKRQNEILEVYKIYSQKYSKLYQMVMLEDLDKNTLRVKLIKRYFILLNKPFYRSHILKISFFRKYKDYTRKEIENCIAML